MVAIDIVMAAVLVGICAAIGEAVLQFGKGGILFSTALSLIGAYLGVQLAQILKLPTIFTVQIGTENIAILWAIIGSGIFLFLLSTMLRRI